MTDGRATVAAEVVTRYHRKEQRCNSSAGNSNYNRVSDFGLVGDIYEYVGRDVRFSP